jgi:antitoxin (DNA-binding transcriptional repressor) of toxin-antitoxin stability system
MCSRWRAGGCAAEWEEKTGGDDPERVGVCDLRGNLTGYLRQVRLGCSFLVTSRDQVLAELRPPPPVERSRRKPGALRGRIRMAPDFDTLPADVLAALEGRGEG